jgi:hypothetical protein
MYETGDSYGDVKFIWVMTTRVLAGLYQPFGDHNVFSFSNPEDGESISL